MDYKYFICDVFTTQRFSGNPLAVFPNAEGLSDLEMQKIAREFNFSETTFVFPAELGHTFKVRIFTPTTELPFAGHPNIGTAFILAQAGFFGEFIDEISVVFEEGAGLVPVSINRDDLSNIYCELAAPELLSLGKTISVESIAKILNIGASDILTNTHLPQESSVGLAFTIVELASYEALKRVSVDAIQALQLKNQGLPADILLYVQSYDDFDIRARMFAPLDGVREDPATGSANCALVALLSHYSAEIDGDFRWRISQGVEMGRPSVLMGRSKKRNGQVLKVWMAGNSILVSEGALIV